MKVWFKALKTGMVLLAAALIVSTSVSARMVDRIVAIVNDEIITQAELEERILELLEMQGKQIPLEKIPPQVYQGALKQLIDQQLIVQQAKTVGAKVTSDEVTHKLREIQEQFPNEEAFEDWMASHRFTIEQLRLKVRNKLLSQKVVDSVIRPRIRISPQELTEASEEIAQRDRFARLLVRHILIRVSEERTESEARELMQQIVERINSGIPFADLAVEFSEDPNASDGGRLAWVSRGQLLPELDEALFKLDVGEVSPVIKTGIGYHLLFVEDVEKQEAGAEEDSSERAFLTVYEAKFNEAMTAWLEELMEDAYIEIPNSVLSP